MRQGYLVAKKEVKQVQANAVCATPTAAATAPTTAPTAAATTATALALAFPLTWSLALALAGSAGQTLAGRRASR